MFRTWKSKTHQGINHGRNSFFNYLLNADDKVNIQNNEDELQRAIFELNKIDDNYDLKILVTKTRTVALNENIL
jgi:hypothetical protein